MEFDFLSPLQNEFLEVVYKLDPQQLGSKIVFHTKDHFPDLNKVTIAIVGVLDNRGHSMAASVDLTAVRQELYTMFPGNWDASIADLGDIAAGNSIDDSYFALKKIVAHLIKNRIIPIVIGGSQDLTYGLYRAYDELEQMVNLVAIDSKFDFGKENENVSAGSYLTKIIIDEPNNLFNYCNIGYQTYYNSQEEIDLIEKLFFDAYRLGEISNNLALAEPVFRDADIVSLDLNAIKSADSGNFSSFAPNGFNGKEICSLARYAGISDKVSSFGIFNHDSSAQEAPLIAQIIWYFIEGFHYRSNEYPFGSRENYIKYIVPSEDETLVFFKSDKTDRWWIEIPFISNVNNKLKRNTLLPCSYDEYLGACNQELPERWWKAQRKNTV
ncbi:formimidoylglutamase [Flavobacterium sp. F-380]|uniref:Formimidoylglutamase n=1 Tax=Flavobacterium kayseriense TaxID=2764714 RepID=A0ABR7J305_9FLAO|nr:formimidoylglutamase [Flavobacterium kayseriense]MBC5839939.1 formimidoylglutamase [Flavobacterium kayseriense]MBC5847391.1 formimidoylglutamase [Flavobacterium kayseriense]MBU0940143.1 formimidoylglutamase [Bacteroidota bacterium]